ncbi:hypothetical protein Taro_039325 [Colocasia esculenta]|uniref:Uncharacterized protein n=1 Tax=Colocasia esculenta TaxID=4460 RepID=A0A843WLV6_COLES|nr:hypothetical protein [Colocasia esculenta]
MSPSKWAKVMSKMLNELTSVVCRIEERDRQTIRELEEFGTKFGSLFKQMKSYMAESKSSTTRPKNEAKDMTNMAQSEEGRGSSTSPAPMDVDELDKVVEMAGNVATLKEEEDKEEYKVIAMNEEEDLKATNLIKHGQGKVLWRFSGRFVGLVVFLACSHRKDLAWSGGNVEKVLFFVFFAELVSRVVWLVLVERQLDLSSVAARLRGRPELEMADRRDWGGGGDEPEESTQRMIERIWESLTNIWMRMDQQAPVPPAAVPPVVEGVVPVAPVPPPPGVEVPLVVPVPPPPPPVRAVEEPMLQVERFLRLQLPTYTGGPNLDTTEHWIHEIERVFVTMRCPPVDRVVLATY